MTLTILSIAYPLAPVGPDAADGSEQILSILDRTLVRNGHRSVVIACEGSRMEGKLIAIPLDRNKLDDGARERAQERYREAIANALDRWDFDLVHMHSLEFHAYLPPPGPPVLATLHLPPDWYPQHVFRPTRPDTWLQCVSASQQRNCPPSDALLGHIENGVALDQLRTTVRRRGYVLALGRICPEKGFHLAAEAAQEAGCGLIVAGELFHYRAHEEYFQRELAPRLDGRMRRFIGPVGLARKRRLLAGARCRRLSNMAAPGLSCGTPATWPKPFLRRAGSTPKNAGPQHDDDSPRSG